MNPANLSLSKASKYEVANSTPHYRQYIKYENGKLQLLTPNFQSDSLKLKESGSDFSVLVPVVPWLRNQLNMVETFAEQNVSFASHALPTNGVHIYKPLWGGDKMYVQMSRWCHIFRKNLETGQYDTVDVKTPLGRGTYNITIEVPYVYIGPHKNGENYSLSTRIVQIVFEPDAPPPPSFSFKPLEKRGRPRKNAPPQIEVSKA